MTKSGKNRNEYLRKTIIECTWAGVICSNYHVNQTPTCLTCRMKRVKEIAFCLTRSFYHVKYYHTKGYTFLQIQYFRSYSNLFAKISFFRVQTKILSTLTMFSTMDENIILINRGFRDNLMVVLNISYV